MTARDAVELCEALRPHVAIPVHYEGWSHFREGQRGIDEVLAAAPVGIRERFRVLPIGMATELLD